MVDETEVKASEETEQEMVAAWQMTEDRYNVLMEHVQKTNELTGEVLSRLTIQSTPQAEPISETLPAPETLVIEEQTPPPQSEAPKSKRDKRRKRFGSKRQK